MCSFNLVIAYCFGFVDAVSGFLCLSQAAIYNQIMIHAIRIIWLLEKKLIFQHKVAISTVPA